MGVYIYILVTALTASDLIMSRLLVREPSTASVLQDPEKLTDDNLCKVSAGKAFPSPDGTRVAAVTETCVDVYDTLTGAKVNDGLICRTAAPDRRQEPGQGC